jgi:hypothetical protein
MDIPDPNERVVSYLYNSHTLHSYFNKFMQCNTTLVQIFFQLRPKRRQIMNALLQGIIYNKKANNKLRCQPKIKNMSEIIQMKKLAKVWKKQREICIVIIQGMKKREKTLYKRLLKRILSVQMFNWQI